MATAELVSLVCEKVGRNLLQFQRIEVGLKVILPYMHPSGSKAGPDALKSYLGAVNKLTLGQLVGELAEAAEIPEGFFDNKLKDVVQSRNDLAHGFYQLHSALLYSDVGLSEVAEKLDAQFVLASELDELIRLLTLPVLKIIVEKNPEMEAEFAMLLAGGSQRTSDR